MKARNSRLHRSGKISLELSGLRLLGRALGDVGVAPGELIDTAGGIDELLLAREKRVARRANTNFQVRARRTRMILCTTGATYGGFDVFGMDT